MDCKILVLCKVSTYVQSAVGNVLFFLSLFHYFDITRSLTISPNVGQINFVVLFIVCFISKHSLQWKLKCQWTVNVLNVWPHCNGSMVFCVRERKKEYKTVKELLLKNCSEIPIFSVQRNGSFFSPFSSFVCCAKFFFVLVYCPTFMVYAVTDEQMVDSFNCSFVNRLSHWVK